VSDVFSDLVTSRHAACFQRHTHRQVDILYCTELRANPKSELQRPAHAIGSLQNSNKQSFWKFLGSLRVARGLAPEPARCHAPHWYGPSLRQGLSLASETAAEGLLPSFQSDHDASVASILLPIACCGGRTHERLSGLPVLLLLLLAVVSMEAAPVVAVGCSCGRACCSLQLQAGLPAVACSCNGAASLLQQ